MKVSLAALRINATPATIRPALKGAMVGHSRRNVCHVERFFVVMHSKNQHLLK